MDYRNLTFAFQVAAPGKISFRMSGGGEATELVDFRRLQNLLPQGDALASPMCESDGSSRNFTRPCRSAPESPEEVGEQLFDSLFVGKIRELLCSHLGAVERGDHCLRLRLALDITDSKLRQLQNLPWELLWYSSWGIFFGLDRRFSLVRSLDVPRASEPYPPVQGLTCLVAASSPNGLPKLDLEGEIDRIKKALADQGKITASYLDAAGPQSIRERLLEPPAQILHFAGHGYDEEGLGLVLQDHHKEPVFVEAARWAEQVADIRLRLVVLNACSTAVPSSSASQPFHGVAQALIRAGIPAVVAMREPILDSAGLLLAKTFYGRLAAGDPIDAALVESRKALRHTLPDRSDWAIPALFLRGEDARLFAETPVAGIPAATDSPPHSGLVQIENLKDHNEVLGNEQVGVGPGAGYSRGEVKIGTAGSRNRIVGNSQRA